MPTIAAIFDKRVAANPASPMLTWYDGATGERTELSGATLANWVAKTANLLVDGLGLGEGDLAVVDLPPHWQTAAILLGCWTAGLTVATDKSAPDSGDVSFGLSQSTADFVVGLHPFALPVREVPPGAQDWVLAARMHGDHYRGPLNAGPSVDADMSEIGQRALINVDSHPDPLDWLVKPLAAGWSLVLCRNADAASRQRWATAERATITVE